MGNGRFKRPLPGSKVWNPHLFPGTDGDINIQKVEGSLVGWKEHWAGSESSFQSPVPHSLAASLHLLGLSFFRYKSRGHIQSCVRFTPALKVHDPNTTVTRASQMEREQNC